ncbi:carbohydrate ABC transporter permease [Nocardia sp. NPDC059239]|uniref:carbohydrate ABC transporter permease n=1 Tax=Nocardia sp. NPDC059239 TaxID=3346785 RepID=UPI0036B6D30A
MVLSHQRPAALIDRITDTADRAATLARRIRIPARWAPLLLTSPALVLLAVFVLMPVIVVAALSLFNYDLLAGTTSYVGLGNYRTSLSNGQLQQGIWHTLLYWLLTVPAIVGLGLAIAVAINTLTHGRSLWRTAYFLPAAATLAAMSVVWAWMFYPTSGVIDSTIGRLTGVTDWLDSTTLALPAVAIVGSWQGIGSSMIMCLAGLNNVNPDLLEAARLDRAGAWARLCHVTLPALGPALVFSIIVATRNSLSVFDQIQVMTQGGPVQSSATLSFLMWQRAITFSDIGGGSVISLTLLGLVLAATALQLRSFGRRWESAGRR